MYIILKKKIQCHGFQRLRSCPVTIPDHSFVATHMLLSVQSVTFFRLPFLSVVSFHRSCCYAILIFSSSLLRTWSERNCLCFTHCLKKLLSCSSVFFLSKTVAKDVLSVYEFLIILFKINFTEALLIPFLVV